MIYLILVLILFSLIAIAFEPRLFIFLELLTYVIALMILIVIGSFMLSLKLGL